MQRKAKIVAVPIDAPVAETVVEPVQGFTPEVQNQGEDKTDAEEMTNVMNELKTDDQPVAQEVAEPVAEPKAKPKRAPRAKKEKVSEPVQAEVVAVEPSLEATTVEVTVPEEKPAAAVVKDKVACPDCGKQMSAKTLKYSHAPNCTAKQINAKEELLENLIEQRLTSVRKERLARKQALMEKLVSNAF
jgi:hypothetical protein